MIRAITLQNFKSFGNRQRVPLDSISVLVGPNNSGKSNFVSVVRFIQDALTRHNDAVSGVGLRRLLHRPPTGGGDMHIAWESEGGNYSVTILPIGTPFSLAEEVRDSARVIYTSNASGAKILDNNTNTNWLLGASEVDTFGTVASSGIREAVHGLIDPFAWSREAKLNLEACRAPSVLNSVPALDSSGANLASVVAYWRSRLPDRANKLDVIVAGCMPEIKRVLAEPTPDARKFQLVYEQTDGLFFDAEAVSDGVLAFTALAAHTLASEPGAIVVLEEPERYVHPRRIKDVVDLLRTLVHEHQTQFIVATHSPVLLNCFKDEPESVLLFRRSKFGTVVRQLSSEPDLLATLQNANPGDLLADGVFNLGDD